MTHTATAPAYSLVGRNTALAVERGLAAAEWYHTDVPRKRMKELMRRRNGPGLRDTAIWIGLLVGLGFGGYWFWGGWACVPFFIGYGVLYGSASDSRWHECGHGTAFRTQRLNDGVYQVASFMTMREPTVSRWSHTRHHTDTLIVGRDREIVAMRPPNVRALALSFLAIPEVIGAVKSICRHAAGRLSMEEEAFLPELERRRVSVEARAWATIYVCLIVVSIDVGSWLPLMYVGLPTLYGRWLAAYLDLTQHAGLAENVLDHRLNSRTIRMNLVLRFIYWNMNYHVEHHMFPMVPYYALAKLNAEVQSDMPIPYQSTIEAYREILPTLRRQLSEPGYFIKRKLPPSAHAYRPEFHELIIEHGNLNR